MTRETIDKILFRHGIHANSHKIVNDIWELLKHTEEPHESVVESPIWEVVEYKSIDGTVWIKKENSKFSPREDTGVIDEGGIVGCSSYKIYAIKVGKEVYRVGDKIVWDWASVTRAKWFQIKGFRTICDKSLRMSIEGGTEQDVKLLVEKSNLRHHQEPEKRVEDKVEIAIGDCLYKVTQEMADKFNQILQDAIKEQQKPILVTEDGVKIYNPEQVVYKVNKDRLWQTSEPKAKNVQKAPQSTMKVYSNPEDRQKYIRDNKPLFNIHEIEAAIQNSSLSGHVGDVIKGLQKVAQQKLTNK